MQKTNIQLERIALSVRKSIIGMLLEAKSGHSAGSLGMTDVLVALYFSVLRHHPTDPAWSERDRLILSNGHICPALYATLSHAGYLAQEELLTLRKLGSRLQGHPHRESLPGLETTSGPLGSGLSQAIGMALAARMEKAPWRTFCLLSDGELQEGNTWEAFLFGGKEQLTSLTAIIDRNHIQIDGRTEDVLPLEPLKEKLQAFNWNVLEMNGHDFTEILATLKEADEEEEKPSVIIAHTIPGRGVAFMENQYIWHGKAPNAKEAEVALRLLQNIRTLNGRIEAGHGN